MPLCQCPDCKQVISSSLRICTHCGADTQRYDNGGGRAVVFALALSAAAALGGYLSSPPSTGTAPILAHVAAMGGPAFATRRVEEAAGPRSAEAARPRAGRPTHLSFASRATTSRYDSPPSDVADESGAREY